MTDQGQLRVLKAETPPSSLANYQPWPETLMTFKTPTPTVRTVDHLHPEDEAMLQALYSRSAASVSEHLQKLAKTGSGKFMEQFYVGYGHASIGDCGTTTLFFENVSTLAAKAIQDWPRPSTVRGSSGCPRCRQGRRWAAGSCRCSGCSSPARSREASPGVRPRSPTGFACRIRAARAKTKASTRGP